MSRDLMQTLEAKAKAAPKRVALPESSNEMILKAAEQMVQTQIGTPVLIGNLDEIGAAAKTFGVCTQGFSYFDNTDEDNLENLAQNYSKEYDALSLKGALRKAKNPINCAMLLAKTGRVDCVAAGREYTTADVIIAAQMILGLKEGVRSPSSIGILNIPNYDGPQGNMLAIGDCAMNAWPDSETLADIAISSADTVQALLDWEPRVALLAFSTCGSSEDSSIDMIRTVIDNVRYRRPNLKIDGEFQLDAAIVPKVAANKVKRDSEVAGQANILIFPNLHAGNIGVKLIQQFGHADAYGPVLQGFAGTICDFSRSAPLSEMMGNIIMLIVRAGAGV